MVMLLKIKNDVTNQVLCQGDIIKKVSKQVSNLRSKEVVLECQIISL